MSETTIEEFPREAIFTYKGVKYYATRLDYLQSIINNLTSLPILQEGEITPFITTSITSTLPIISETVPSKEKRKKEKVKEHSKSSPKSVRTSTKSKTKSVKERKPLDKPYTKEQLEDLLRGTKISSPEVTTEGGLLTVRATIDLTEKLYDKITGKSLPPTRVKAGNIIFKVNPKTGNIRRVQTKASANDPNVMDENVLEAIDKFREYEPIEKFFFTEESKIRSSTKQGGGTEKTKSKRDIIEVKKKIQETEEVIPELEESTKINLLRERLEETKKREEAITESEESERVKLARERLMGSEIEDITPAKEIKEVKESVIPPPKTSLTTSRSKLLGTTGGVLSKPLQSSTRKSTRVISAPVPRGITTSLPTPTVSIFEEEENIPVILPTVAPNKPSEVRKKKIVEEIDEDEPKEDLSSSTSESSESKDVVVPSSESSSDDSSGSSSTEEV